MGLVAPWPGSGTEPTSPALAGGCFTTEPPEKPPPSVFNHIQMKKFSHHPPTPSSYLLPYNNLFSPLTEGNLSNDYTCLTSLIPQLVKSLPAMQVTPGRFLGQEDPLEKGQATHSNNLGLPLWLSW